MAFGEAVDAAHPAASRHTASSTGYGGLTIAAKETRRRLVPLVVGFGLLLGVAAACGDSPDHAARAAATPAAAATSSPTPDPTTPAPTTPPATTTPPAPIHVATTPPKAPTAPPKPAPPPSLLVDHLAGVGNAQQVIAVVNSSYGDTYATLTAYQRSASGWTQVFGPWTARIGYNGFAPPGAKHEGDGRTPTGAYGFQYFFGVDANPGVRYQYRQVTGSYDVWDDDPASPSYNLWVDTRSGNAGRSPEPLMQQPAYDYAAVIAYNTARTPGAGSAIFFHVSHSSPTAGCVSLPMPQLLQVLRWLDPAASPRIVMGRQQDVTG